MQTLFTFVSPLDRCGYRPDQDWSLRYDVMGELTPEECAVRLQNGWRRFGHSLFRPECPECRLCRSLRVRVADFHPSEGQRRVRKKNENPIRCVISDPSVTAEKLTLYDKFHRFQTDLRGWPDHGKESASAYLEAFVENPFVTQEWNYFLQDRLIGVGYVDRLPIGLSAIYFFYDPEERQRSLGTWNVLSVIAAAQQWKLEHVYLGYFVSGCLSLEYKAKFRPNEILQNGRWKPYIP